MPDYIEIKDLLLRTIVGINAEERDHRQDVLLNLRLDTDLKPAGRSDDIDDTLNYRTLCKQVIERVENSKYLLVEKLAEEVAAVCLSFPRVSQVRVSLEKPGALRFARSVGVVIERSRNDR
ncbi:dihydroneopterin aldolase [Planctomicrobium piriforme]|uniref:7,8-dihydroneopterin aldolase n=1 Tax=Planctomicrobium piriforme TaxID=1576369 RepID=A0A1I3QCI7_9PLAN|nr:dihydroneopterin aldolase [Planctomicrobium piriforme]SFJ31618.1 dihydroneopterin aldolase/D-erythro-7,8-dihydroneopterin triphosphate epimerase [Planctomicrobium piriforme]